MTTASAMSGNSSTTCHVAVDIVVLAIQDGVLKVLLIERGKEPFRGRLALPGGYLEPHESLDDAARRELHEETGLGGDDLYLEQLSAYGSPNRDPRGRVVSVAYVAISPYATQPMAASDAAAATWEPAESVMAARARLAFDHQAIIIDAIERIRERMEYTTCAASFCAESFTVGDLREVYETIWGVKLDPRNFSRKVFKATGFIEPTGNQRTVTGRPAALYQRGPIVSLSPPMLRASVVG